MPVEFYLYNIEGVWSIGHNLPLKDDYHLYYETINRLNIGKRAVTDQDLIILNPQ